MIRRKPTVITITSEDILVFEESRLLQQQQQEQQLQQKEQQQSAFKSIENKAGFVDPNDELKPLPGDKARIIRNRDERIGIARRN